MFLRHCAGAAAVAAPLNAAFSDSRDNKTIVNTPSTVPNGINKHSQHRDHKDEKITLAAGQKSAGNDNANRQTLPHKEKAAAQNDEQSTDKGWRRLIAGKPTTNHHQTDGQMNKWETDEERCNPTDDIVKYREH
jgi:uncharacterized protein with WD repeat